MVLSREDLQDWNMDTLKNYLTERVVTSSVGESRNTDLIRNILVADLLQLPTLPSQEETIREYLVAGFLN